MNGIQKWLVSGVAGAMLTLATGVAAQAATAEELSATAEEMNAQAENLNELMTQFKLADDSRSPLKGE